ncbi:riboflavin kinase [Flavihumibacter sp. CACIAM 22H1]|uniref:riboflavin kinase n=1 Tax=Flavihumibacter sp. CACIAM 22H1 TaxID=1812911 RepID=UPI000A9EC142|nr:riboflavin kinase [Flavihumibacter sp. CACIAM 22H1]
MIIFCEGAVVKGNQLGRTLGYPTANLQLTDNEKLIPANGVYAVTVSFPAENGEGKEIQAAGTKKENMFGQLKGMMNIGVRPTVNGLSRVIEVNIFDFNADIYGETISVTLKQWLRAEQKFSGLDALKEQLAKDKLASLHALSTIIT